MPGDPEPSKGAGIYKTFGDLFEWVEKNPVLAAHLLNLPKPHTREVKWGTLEEYKKEAEIGDVLFFSADDPVSKAIRTVSGGPFQHVAVVADVCQPEGKDKPEGKEDDKKIVVLQSTSMTMTDIDGEEKKGQVMIMDFDELLKAEHGSEYFMVRKIEADKDSTLATIQQELLAVANDQDTLDKLYSLGKSIPDVMRIIAGFNPIGVKKFLTGKLPWFRSDKNKTYVCSTFVAYVLVRAGVLKDDTQFQQFFPSELGEKKLKKGDERFMDGVWLSEEFRVRNPYYGSEGGPVQGEGEELAEGAEGNGGSAEGPNKRRKLEDPEEGDAD